jgi:hypothetical protein
MKVKVLIEYDIPCIDALTDEDKEVITQALSDQAPSAFEFYDGGVMLAESWTVEVQTSQLLPDGRDW